MWTICKKFTFEAAHQLISPLLDKERNDYIFGKCAQLHGHSYKVYVYLKSDTLDWGMVENFSLIKDIFMKEIHAKYDHQFLNEKMDGLTTAENLAKEIFTILKDKLIDLNKIRVYETETIWAEYGKD